MIESSGGESCTIPNGTVPHWPGRDGNVNWRASDLAQLKRVEFIEVETVGGNMVIRHGSRTREILAGFLDMLATVKKAQGRGRVRCRSARRMAREVVAEGSRRLSN